MLCLLIFKLGELEKECENGRLLRVLIKLGFVNERPELNGVRAANRPSFLACVIAIHIEGDDLL